MRGGPVPHPGTARSVRRRLHHPPRGRSRCSRGRCVRIRRRIGISAASRDFPRGARLIRRRDPNLLGERDPGRPHSRSAAGTHGGSGRWRCGCPARRRMRWRSRSGSPGYRAYRGAATRPGCVPRGARRSPGWARSAAPPVRSPWRRTPRPQHGSPAGRTPALFGPMPPAAHPSVRSARSFSSPGGHPAGTRLDPGGDGQRHLHAGLAPVLPAVSGIPS